MRHVCSRWPPSGSPPSRRAKLDYLEIVDPVTLDPLVFVDGPATIVAAVWFGDVRLIDNLPLLA